MSLNEKKKKKNNNESIYIYQYIHVCVYMHRNYGSLDSLESSDNFYTWIIYLLELEKEKQLF